VNQPRTSAASAPGARGGRPAGTFPSVDPVAEAPGSTTAPILMGAGLLVACALLLTQVFAIEGDGFSLAGPRFFPLLVVGLLTLLSAVYVLQQVRALTRGTEPLPAERFNHMPAAALLVVVLVGYAFVLNTMGYAVTTAVFFVVTARILGSRHLARDVVVGVGLSLVVYLGFTRLLGVFLPQGVFPL
jgi:putative tricarboxylic transport membrane protein